MKNLLTFIFISHCFFSFAQITFHKTIGGTQDEVANSVQQTADGGYVIVGHTKTFGVGDNDVYLIKTNANGDTLWTRTFGDLGNDQGKSVQQTADGGYIITGLSSSFGAGDIDVFIIKADSNGNTVWTKTFGGSLMDFGYCVSELADGSFVIAGETRSFGAGLGDVYLIKLSSAGDSLWTKTYGGPDADWANSIASCMDGGVIMAGTTKSFGAGDFDVYLVKTDSSGSLLWSKTYGRTNTDVGVSVSQTADSGFIITGNTRSFGAGGTDVYLVKTDSAGDTLWTRAYGGTSFDYGTSVQQTADRGYIIAGYTQSFFASGSDVYLIKTDSSGAIAWSRTYSGTTTELSYAVQQTADGGYVIAGQTISYGAGLFDIYLIKENNIGASGCNEEGPATITTRPPTLVGNAATISFSPAAVVTSPSISTNGGGIITTLCTSVGMPSEISGPKNEISIYPNPFYNELTVRSNSPCEIVLCDYTGKDILHRKINSTEGVLNKGELAAGLYFLKVDCGGGVRNFKVVKTN
jgi:hypothetical protein